MKWEVLRSVLNDHALAYTTDSEFLYLYQRVLLQALAEKGLLTGKQYRYAEGKLRKQRRDQD